MENISIAVKDYYSAKQLICSLFFFLGFLILWFPTKKDMKITHRNLIAGKGFGSYFYPKVLIGYAISIISIIIANT